MYFEDLSEYSYIDKHKRSNMRNVGWLDRNYSFPKGSVSEDFIIKLWNHCLYKVATTRGYHACNICEKTQLNSPVKITFQEHAIVAGTAEIRVFGENIIYAAPNLIFHYITKHNYKPPLEFISAVEKAEYPLGGHYINLLEMNGMSYSCS